MLHMGVSVFLTNLENLAFFPPNIFCNPPCPLKTLIILVSSLEVVSLLTVVFF